MFIFILKYQDRNHYTREASIKAQSELEANDKLLKVVKDATDIYTYSIKEE